MEIEVTRLVGWNIKIVSYLFVAIGHLVTINRPSWISANGTFAPQVAKVPNTVRLTPDDVIVSVCLASEFERVLTSEKEGALEPCVGELPVLGSWRRYWSATVDTGTGRWSSGKPVFWETLETNKDQLDTNLWTPMFIINSLTYSSINVSIVSSRILNHKNNFIRTGLGSYTHCLKLDEAVLLRCLPWLLHWIVTFSLKGTNLDSLFKRKIDKPSFLFSPSDTHWASGIKFYKHRERTALFNTANVADRKSMFYAKILTLTFRDRSVPSAGRRAEQWCWSHHDVTEVALETDQITEVILLLWAAHQFDEYFEFEMVQFTGTIALLDDIRTYRWVVTKQGSSDSCKFFTLVDKMTPLSGFSKAGHMTGTQVLFLWKISPSLSPFSAESMKNPAVPLPLYSS